MGIFYSGCTCTVIFIKDKNTAYVSVRYNAMARQNNVPSESSFVTKSALFGPKNVCPFQILDLTLIVKCGEIWFLWRNMVLCSMLVHKTDVLIV